MKDQEKIIEFLLKKYGYASLRKKGYIKSYHAAEAYVWDANHGVIGQFTSYVDY